MSSLLLVSLPEDALQNIAVFLKASELLQFLSTHRRLYQLSQSESFWYSLLKDSSENHDKESHPTTTSSSKLAYMTRAYVKALPQIHWTPCRSSATTSPSAREGHLAVTLGQRIVMTGGFTNDETV